jgi:hypothetical protein
MEEIIDIILFAVGFILGLLIQDKDKDKPDSNGNNYFAGNYNI